MEKVRENLFWLIVLRERVLSLEMLFGCDFIDSTRAKLYSKTNLINLITQ
jgi:hypothetical protein